MNGQLEIVIPLRNPPSVLNQTVDSLIAQSDRRFSVLLSDNHSVDGIDRIEEAAKAMRMAGIEVRLVKPPRSLGRVEHWNWALFASSAGWLKPLFVGDWLESHAVARWRKSLSEYPDARFVYFGYAYHQFGKEPVSNIGQCIDSFRSPKEMNEFVLRFGHQFGPPNAVLFHREGLQAIGGFRPTLPICADSLLCCELASRFGAVGIPEVLSHFQLHDARFSMSLPGRPAALLREKLTYQIMLAYHAWTEGRSVPLFGLAKMFAREFKAYLRDRRALQHN